MQGTTVIVSKALPSPAVTTKPSQETTATTTVAPQQPQQQLEPKKEEGEETATGQFVLAPTPAQLGKAPLQRRLTSTSTEGSCSSAAAQMNPTMEEPGPKEVPESPGNVPISPTSKKSFFKKNVEDGMDNAIPNTSPRVFVQSYRKKSIAEEEQAAMALTPLEPPTSAAAVENLSSDNSIASARLVGHTFFPPDFNPENPFREEVAASPRTPKTPRTAGGPPSSSGASGESGGDRGHRRVLEQRRNLAEHSDVFPNKGSLQLKIREVRQKLKASANILTPNTPSSPANPPQTQNSSSAHSTAS
ncbi:hypothetical protein B566_EDAN013708 [Ephemera danica]|nr:hypothetical protein B566_EDAN013708 [Ephemera danica]